ncbi:MAG: beta galactosidase jelly roll domain-containing protein [Cyclobacteriaceae bacterium]
MLESKDLRKISDLEESWKFTIGDDLIWANPNFDDSNWESIKVPGAWENYGFNGYDGHAWYRTTFSGSSIRNEPHIYLNLGYIDDVDQVFINGHLIGFSGSFPPDFHTAYKALRLYYVPKKLLKTDGSNVIAVRVFDTVHGGGIISGSIGLYAPNHSIKVHIMEGIWKFSYGDSIDWKQPKFNDTKWENKIVPSFWKSEGWNIKKFYENRNQKPEYGWYRKNFILPDNLNTDNLVAVLGKIDDFDRVFINGKMIGSTNDGKPFGISQSYQETRIYRIPRNYLRDGTNLIAVRVADMGGEAGIYEGPIGILEEDDAGEFIRSER